MCQGFVNKKTLPKGISLRKDGRYQGRFTCDGKRYTLYDKDVVILQKRMSDNRYEAEHGIYKIIGSYSLDQWFHIWLEEYKVIYVKPSTLRLYIDNYNRYVENTLGKKKLDKIRLLDIQKLYNDMLRSQLSIGTVQIVHSILYNLFKQAMRNDLINKNPCIGVIFPKIEKKSPRVLTGNEQQLFLKQIATSFYQPVYMMALATGLRVGELTALTWRDIDFDKKLLYVQNTLLYQRDVQTGKFNFRLQSPKSSTSRRKIPLIPDVLMLLQEQLLNQEKLKQSPRKYWQPLKGFDNLVFTTKHGTPIQEVYLYKNLERITDKMNQYEANLAYMENRLPVYHDKITPHTLRHSFATRAFEKGVAPKAVQDLLGHSALSITMDLYTHVTDDTRASEMNKMSDIFDISV